MGRYVEANPYPYPFNGDLRPENTALIIIDMQTDFCLLPCLPLFNEPEGVPL